MSTSLNNILSLKFLIPNYAQWKAAHKKGLEISLFDWFILNWKNSIPTEFYVRFSSYAKKANLDLTLPEIVKIYKLFKADHDLPSTIIDAKKQGIRSSFQEMIDLHLETTKSKDIIKLALKSKKENIDVAFDDIRSWVIHDRKAAAIIDQIIKAKKNGVSADNQGMAKLFFSKSEYGNFFMAQAIAERNNLNLDISEIKQLIQRDLPVFEIIRLLNKLTIHGIKTKTNKLLKLNTANCTYESWGDILIMLFNKSIEALNDQPLLSDDEKAQIVNTFLFSERSDFSDSLLQKSLPEFCHTNKFQETLFTKIHGGFKLNIYDLYKIDNYVADVEKIVEYYIRCKEKNIKITWQEIAEMAQAQINLEPFIEALIQAQYYERNTG